MSERVCAFTCVDDRGFESRGARKLASSFKHFHGDIDFYVFGDRIVNEVFRQNGRGWYDSKPSFAKRLAER